MKKYTSGILTPLIPLLTLIPMFTGDFCSLQIVILSTIRFGSISLLFGFSSSYLVSTSCLVFVCILLLLSTPIINYEYGRVGLGYSCAACIMARIDRLTGRMNARVFLVEITCCRDKVTNIQ
jgi:hypothetical protein